MDVNIISGAQIPGRIQPERTTVPEPASTLPEQNIQPDSSQLPEQESSNLDVYA